MEHIVLNTNLKFVIARLDSEQRGKLLTALLEVNDCGLDSDVGNIYKYIMLLQEEILNKKQRMRELGAKGGASRKKKTEKSLVVDANINSGIASLKQSLSKRKVTKENIYNKNIKSLFIKNKDKSDLDISSVGGDDFVAPSLDDVMAFINQEGLLVSAEDFVDFYESRGWCMGHVPIRNWQAVVRLWNRRIKNKSSLGEKTNVADDDETYWQELSSKIALETSSEIIDNQDIALDDMASSHDDADAQLSPFSRFIKRVENCDND